MERICELPHCLPKSENLVFLVSCAPQPISFRKDTCISSRYGQDEAEISSFPWYAGTFYFRLTVHSFDNSLHNGEA